MKNRLILIPLVVLMTASIATAFPPGSPKNGGARTFESVTIGILPALTWVNASYDFADATARDAYFTGNPGELVDNVRVHLQSTGFIQHYDLGTTSWINETALTKGPAGAAGADGSDGQDCSGDGSFAALTEEAAPADTDLVLLEKASDGTKRKVQTQNLPGSGGGISSVLDDSSGAVPFFFQSWTAFSAADATPDVSAGQNFRTVDTNTITGFDHGAGAITDGRDLWVYCGAATVFDLTSSEITAANRSTDYTCAAGMVLHFKYNTDQWYAANIPDEYQTLSSDGLVVNNAGTPVARSMGDGDGITWTNPDGVSGNPTPTVAYPFLRDRTVSNPADADDFLWFKAPAVLTLAAFDCVAEGSTPSISVDLQECDSDGASCASVLSSAVTADGGNDAGTISDSSIASAAWMRLILGAPSGTVTAITCTLKGAQ